MTNGPNILEIIESGDIDLFIEVLDKGFKRAAGEASYQSHLLGLDVGDGRAHEDRRRKPVPLARPFSRSSLHTVET